MISWFKSLFVEKLRLFSNVRFYILLFSTFVFVVINLFIKTSTQDPYLQSLLLTQSYALTSITFLYLALLAGPLTYTFRFLPFRGTYLKARRAIGVSAYLFALLHARLGFFEQLGGFGALPSLNFTYLLAITLSKPRRE